MEIGYNFILGAVQGLTELWPISSSAHLYLLPFLTGRADLGLTMSVFLHFGTLIAVLIYFRKDWYQILTKKRDLFWLILLATLPVAVGGLLLEGWAETIFRNPLIIAFNLVLFGLVLALADRKDSKKASKTEDLTYRQGFIIGLSQVLALVPGVSRSGISISTGLFLKLSRKEAARFSFLLLTPTLIGATILRSIDLFQVGLPAVGGSMLAALVGFVSSLLFSYLALYYLFNWLKKLSYWPFVVYRFILGAVVFLIIYI